MGIGEVAREIGRCSKGDVVEIRVSAAADTFVSCTRSTPQRFERRIMLEGSCQGSWALRCRNELLLPILVLFLIAANVVAIQGC